MRRVEIGSSSRRSRLEVGARFVALAVVGLAPGCGARSDLDSSASLDDAPEASSASSTGASSSSSTGAGGGDDAAPISCGSELHVTTAFSLDVSGGAPSRARAVPATARGDVVSVLYEWSAARPEPSAIRATPVQPWGTWPPEPSAPVVLVEEVASPFATAPSAYGSISLLFAPGGARAEEPTGLLLASSLAATAATGFAAASVAAPEQNPRAVALVRGYDAPPIAFNVGYLAMLALFETRSGTRHALTMAVGVSGVGAFGGATLAGEQPDLACADGTIPAAAARVGSSWLVAAGTHGPLARCDSVAVGPPTRLVIDRIAWGGVDTVQWSLSRSAEGDGDGERAVVALEMVPDVDGAWVVAQRAEDADLELLRLAADGSIVSSSRVAGGSSPLTFAGAAIAGGVLIGRVDAAEPTKVGLSLRDRDGVERASGSVTLTSSADSLSMLTSPDGDAVLATATGAADGAPYVDMVRIDCFSEEGT